MSKRGAILQKAVDNGNPKPRALKHWSLGLIDSMNNPELIVKENDKVVVIKDKYPKSKIHYLVIPRDDIDTVYDLNNGHVTLLEEFNKMYEYLKHKHEETVLEAGFHAIPSMHRLHMHVISTDFISPCLKTKPHWNSFNTEFFIPIAEVLKMLIENGNINKIIKTFDEYEALLWQPMECNKCSFKPNNMPQLKKHLLSHQKVNECLFL